MKIETTITTVVTTADGTQRTLTDRRFKNAGDNTRLAAGEIRKALDKAAQAHMQAWDAAGVL